MTIANKKNPPVGIGNSSALIQSYTFFPYTSDPRGYVRINYIPWDVNDQGYSFDEIREFITIQNGLAIPDEDVIATARAILSSIWSISNVPQVNYGTARVLFDYQGWKTNYCNASIQATVQSTKTATGSIIFTGSTETNTGNARLLFMIRRLGEPDIKLPFGSKQELNYGTATVQLTINDGIGIEGNARIKKRWRNDREAPWIIKRGTAMIGRARYVNYANAYLNVYGGEY